MNIMNVLRTGMDTSIPRIHIWLCNMAYVYGTKNFPNKRYFRLRIANPDNKSCYSMSLLKAE